MVGSARFPYLSRWLLPTIILLLIVGHACELPAFAGLMSGVNVPEDAHHAPEGDADEHVLACDGVEVVTGSGFSAVSAGLITATSQSRLPAPSYRPVVTALLDPATRPIRPPLFLLFTSLLI